MAKNNMLPAPMWKVQFWAESDAVWHKSLLRVVDIEEVRPDGSTLRPFAKPHKGYQFDQDAPLVAVPVGNGQFVDTAILDPVPVIVDANPSRW